MESDLSNSDAALRMLFVEDVELLESGIFTRKSLVLAYESVTEVRAAAALFRSYFDCAERTELVCIRTGFLFLWSNLFAVSDVKHANLALINQCTASDTSYFGAHNIYDLFCAPQTHARTYKHTNTLIEVT